MHPARAAQILSFRRRLLAWYRANGRTLPWRRTRDPYRILVSEIMLQQTQVERVKDYYGRFLRRYPTFDDLAAADQPAVRESWEGLGYYARARNLHRTAQLVVGEHGGRLPDDAQMMRRLPGIGRYTAGAVLSIAYGKDEPILDTNAARVLTRVFGVRKGGSKGRLQRRLWELAAQVTPSGVAGDFNQAIMDLGATICRARRPLCRECPVRRLCRTRRE
jgi:A/G-specific adenine glycosylase